MKTEVLYRRLYGKCINLCLIAYLLPNKSLRGYISYVFWYLDLFEIAS